MKTIVSTVAILLAAFVAFDSRLATASSGSGSGSGGGGGARVEKQFFLTPSLAGLKAKARYRVSGANRDFRVEAEHIRLAPGTRLSVHVNGAVVGFMLVDGLHSARPLISHS